MQNSACGVALAVTKSARLLTPARFEKCSQPACQPMVFLDRSDS